MERERHSPDERHESMEPLDEALPIVYLARHGETAWSITSHHTSFTDLPLTERGERNATVVEGATAWNSLRESFHQSADTGAAHL